MSKNELPASEATKSVVSPIHRLHVKLHRARDSNGKKKIRKEERVAYIGFATCAAGVHKIIPHITFFSWSKQLDGRYGLSETSMFAYQQRFQRLRSTVNED